MCGITDADAQDMWQRMNTPTFKEPEVSKLEKLRRETLLKLSEALKAERELYRYEEEHGFGHMSTPYSLRLMNDN